MGSKYKDALVQELWEKEPDETFTNESGEEFRLYSSVDGFEGVILCEDGESVSGIFYEDADELTEAWDELAEDDEDDEDDE